MQSTSPRMFTPVGILGCSELDINRSLGDVHSVQTLVEGEHVLPMKKIKFRE